MVEKLRIEPHGSTSVTKLVGTLNDNEQDPINVYRRGEDGSERWVAQAQKRTESYRDGSGNETTRDIYTYSLPVSRLSNPEISGWIFRAHQRRTPDHGDPMTNETPINIEGAKTFTRLEIIEENRKVI